MKSIGCDTNLSAVKTVKCINAPTRSWKEFIGANHSVTFNFKPLTMELGTISIGMLGTEDEILSDGDSIMIKYKDGTKWTINKSWFELSRETDNLRFPFI